MRGLAERGRTILFATHYLEEADANADRVVLMARGRIVADGPTTEIKAMVGTRTIRATLPDVPLESLRSLPGVTGVERHGEAVTLVCADSDAALRALLDAFPAARDIEVRGAGLEQAFLELTGEDADLGAAEAAARDLADLPAPGASPHRAQPALRVLSLGFPLVLYLVFAGPQRNTHDFGGSGIDAPLYYMIGLAAFGTMSACSRAARASPPSARRLEPPAAADAAPVSRVLRREGRDGLRARPRHARRARRAGTALGVRLSAGRWLEMTALILVGLIPFAAIGIFIGPQIGVDSIGPAMGGTTALFALLGGTWYPLQDGTLRDIGRDLPSYWLVQASHVSLGGSAWSRHGWLVVAAWTVGFTILAAPALPHRHASASRLAVEPGRGQCLGQVGLAVDAAGGARRERPARDTEAQALRRAGVRRGAR